MFKNIYQEHYWHYVYIHNPLYLCCSDILGAAAVAVVGSWLIVVAVGETDMGPMIVGRGTTIIDEQAGCR